MNVEMCPREKWLVDLAQFIETRKQAKEQIIVLADFNEDVGSNRMKNWAKDLDLKDLLNEKLQASPPTTNKGSSTIDGIFASQSINAVKAGYSKFGLFRSDHRALWVDIKEANMLGLKSPKIIQPSARRLQCGIPSVKRKWKQLYNQKLTSHNLFNKQFKLERDVMENGGKMDEALIEKFEKIMEIRLQCMAYAEKNCRKLKMGRLPFSPETTKA